MYICNYVICVDCLIWLTYYLYSVIDIVEMLKL